MFPNTMQRLRDLIRRPPAPPIAPIQIFGSAERTWGSATSTFGR